jgi:PTS system nitrogen regulatory IIA component
MLISDLLNPERVHCNIQSSSKKRLLELISEDLARQSDQLTKRQVFESLIARERLGSTGLGKGVAIPHGRVKGSSNVQASFIRLKTPVSFEAIDGQPVDLLFCLTVPEDCSEDHLKLLAQVAELFSNADLLRELRAADSSERIIQLLSSSSH